MIQHIVIAIDGPAASGKTTVGILVAKRLGISFLDSGRLYRVAAVASEKLGLDLPQLLDKIDLELKNGLFILDGQDVTDLLGTVEIGEKASQMSVDPALREWVNKTIRGLAADEQGRPCVRSTQEFLARKCVRARWRQSRRRRPRPRRPGTCIPTG